MKTKTLNGTLTLVMICALLFTLTGCGTTLKGTYTNTDGYFEQSFTFLEDNKVRVTAFDIDIEGEYEIDEGTITITYSLFNLHYDWVKSFKKDGKSIFIDGVEFVKES